jgi:CBS domain-containing membrane protein
MAGAHIGSVLWLVAPMGASAVLVFCAPGSPMAQPWAAVGGNAISAFVGICFVHGFGSSPGAAALAVAIAILSMYALRCLHPPGGATALLVVLNNVKGFEFVLFPLMLNCVVLVVGALVYHRLTGRLYPHDQHACAYFTTRADDVDSTVSDENAVAARHSALASREAQAQAANDKHFTAPPSNRNADKEF